MIPDLDRSVALLERTPKALDTLLRGLPDDWTRANEGDGTWSAFDVLGHLIHGEEADWIPRTETILEHGTDQAFDPFDRFAQFEASEGKTLPDLLDRFAELRSHNLKTLRKMQLNPQDLDRTGKHPEFGVVTLGQLLATWVAHDLSHIGQIARVMAKQYAAAVGPWSIYLSILHR